MLRWCSLSARSYPAPLERRVVRSSGRSIAGRRSRQPDPAYKRTSPRRQEPRQSACLDDLVRPGSDLRTRDQGSELPIPSISKVVVSRGWVAETTTDDGSTRQILCHSGRACARCRWHLVQAAAPCQNENGCKPLGFPSFRQKSDARRKIRLENQIPLS